MKFGKWLWGVFSFSFQSISEESGVYTDSVHLIMFSSKVLFIVIYVEPSRTLNRAFHFSFSSTKKPGKETLVHT